MPKDNGGPAFPREGTGQKRWNEHFSTWVYDGERPNDGMSLRDFLAAHALAQFGTIPHVKYEYAAEECYKIADAMLAERAK